MRMIWIGLCFLIIWAAPVAAFQQPLPVEEVFKLSAERTATNQVILNWQIAPGYYLYRDRFSFRCQDEICRQNTAGVEQTAPIPIFPSAKLISNSDIGNYAVYEHQVSVPLQISRDAAVVWVTYQGCSASGFCYPPISKVIHLNNPDQRELRVTNDMAELAPPKEEVASSASDLFSSKRSLGFVLGSFFGLGLLLGFTPCVFPMIPILASIIVGHAHTVSRVRAFKLALTYVMSSAVTYAAAGMAVGWAGSYVQAIFQQPWMLVLASVMLVLLAFSLFGFYELQLPASLRNHLSHHSHKQRGGTYIGVVVMGCLATLIISPCVSAPLVGALGYISSTGDMYLGGAALFLLGLGMGLPLLVILTVGSRYLPKSGRWMNAIRALCGGLLLIVAATLFFRVFPEPVNWLFPNTQTSGELVFKSIKNTDDLDKALLQAKHQGKPVFLDFYADWCITCKKLEKYTFHNPQVLSVLKQMVLLRADVTANNAEDKALQKRLGVFAPPTILLFDAKGKELVEQRVVGDISPEELLKKLKAV
jgi:thiol:disulfide interchange protein DsbD